MSRAAILDELACYLRPPGRGIHTVSTGRAELEAFTRRYLGASFDEGEPWRAHLERTLTPETTLAMLAIPSDTGAGIMRGASHGPRAIREALEHAPIPDLGDVFVVPQLLDDEMLSPAQLHRTQDALYPHIELPRRRTYPVSPLSTSARATALALALSPQLRPLVLGGDHTVTWGPLDTLLGADPLALRDVAIVHFDAHTDLLPDRLGVRVCFATWAYHANERLGRGRRLLQLGIRASARDKTHWEQSLGVRQIWAAEANTWTPAQLASEVVGHLVDIGAKRVYVSNDIDGTDSYYAAACGTPEAGGLSPEAVSGVLEGLRRSGLQIIGADVVELAPGLSLDGEAARRSIQTAVRYVRDEIELLRASVPAGAAIAGNTPT